MLCGPSWPEVIDSIGKEIGVIGREGLRRPQPLNHKVSNSIPGSGCQL